MEKRQVLRMFNEKFGTEISTRLIKLSEEYGELMCAGSKDVFASYDNMDDFVDELADVNAVLFHIAGILGYSQDQLLDIAVDKVVGRERDPDYKRKHPHVSQPV